MVVMVVVVIVEWCMRWVAVMSWGGSGSVSDPVDKLADGDPGGIAGGHVGTGLGLELRVTLRHRLKLSLVPDTDVRTP